MRFCHFYNAISRRPAAPVQSHGLRVECPVNGDIAQYNWCLTCKPETLKDKDGNNSAAQPKTLLLAKVSPNSNHLHNWLFTYLTARYTNTSNSNAHSHLYSENPGIVCIKWLLHWQRDRTVPFWDIILISRWQAFSVSHTHPGPWNHRNLTFGFTIRPKTWDTVFIISSYAEDLQKSRFVKLIRLDKKRQERPTKWSISRYLSYNMIWF